MQDLSVVSQLIVQLLTTQSPEFGARLKQRLNILLAEQGFPNFDERKFGYRKFYEFLKKTQGDKLNFERRSETGDILVSLKTIEPSRASTSTMEAVHTLIRSDIWQAFVNPDPSRRRFLHKNSYLVRHFIDGDASSAQTEVSNVPSDFIEITPILGAVQHGWMVDFLNSIPIQGAERVPFDAMLSQPYSSSINVTFTRALGNKGSAWRHYRTKKVVQFINHWAEENGVALDKLHKPPTTLQTIGNSRPVESPPRVQALKLLELISDEDISRLVLPTLLSTIWIRSRV